MMKFNKILLLALMTLFIACSNEEDTLMSDAALEMKGIRAMIDDEMLATRAVAKLGDVVGRSAFTTDDKIVFTSIKRAQNPLEAFTYSNIIYAYDGNSWERTEGNKPEKIYWTDGASYHTFIGYSLPSSTYHWETVANSMGSNTFAGELGYGLTELDYTSGNEALVAEDLLVNYSDTTKAESDGLSTKIKFTHALSNVRVVVNIKNFAASASAVDTKVGVSNMVLYSQPCLFTWGANSKDLTVKNFSEQTDHIRDLKLWCPKADGEGTAQSKTFTFYGLTTPQDATFHAINGNNQSLTFSFTVTYPDAMNPSETVTKTYKGSFVKTVNFYSGMCTTLNISLNHKDEQMYMDVEYNDWNYVATPDLGELRKKSTFMDINTNVTIHSDANANVYDATWLYKDASGNLKDIYGNDGSWATPFRISSASQLLSFAKEVSNGLDFDKKYVRLDADITMQASTAKTKVEDSESTVSPVSWIGIGDATHPFNGTFLGGDRYINRLYGSPLFINLGEKACVEQLQITTIGSISGGGALAETNAGVIGACKVIDDVTVAVGGGALVGTNSGTIYASYHTGTTPLVGTENGSTIGCYTANDIISFDESHLKELITILNTALTTLYSTNTTLTQYKFVYATANYPIVQK